MSCPICTDPFQQTQQPKVLTCGHTFCTGCLSDWFKTQQEQSFTPSGTVQCPVCRRNTSLPAAGGGVAALPTNFALLELVEDSEASVEDGSDVSRMTCSIHTGKPLEYSCETCSGELVCGQCVKSKHQPATGHRIINLSTAMEREQKEKAELQRKILELQELNSELTCSTSFAISKPNFCDNNGQTKLKTSVAEIVAAKNLLKTKHTQGESPSSDIGLVSNAAEETAAVDKVHGEVLDGIQNAQAGLRQITLSPSSQQKTTVSSSLDLYVPNPSDPSPSRKPTVLPKPARRSRPHSVILSPSSQQKTDVSSSKELHGPNPSHSRPSGMPTVLPKPVRRSRPNSVVLSPNSKQDTAVNSSSLQQGGVFIFGPTPAHVIQSTKPNVSPKPTARPCPDSQSLLQGGTQPGFTLYNPSARNPQFIPSTDSLQPDETDTEMLSARDRLAKVLQSSRPRAPQP